MARLRELSRKPYFTLGDVAQNFSLQLASARVLCSRYVQQGLLVRFKNNIYTTAWKWGASRHKGRGAGAARR